jgi:hypothetical protein
MTAPDFTDEELSAFLDGELPSARAAALEAALETDEALVARIERLTATDDLVRAANPLPPAEATPPALLRAAEALAAAQLTPPENVVAFRTKTRPAGTVSRWSAALAACLTLVLGGVMGAGLQTARLGGEGQSLALDADVGVIRAANPLYAALETTPSGTSTAVPGGVVKPVLSFVDPDQRGCREFEMAEAGAVSVGVACKSGEIWRIEVLLAAAPQTPGGTGYVPASGHNDAALGAVLDRLMPGEALAPEAEADLMKKGWQAKTE